MGIYDKIGLRKTALSFTELINWIRLYQLKDGWKLYRSLRKKSNNFFYVKASFFKSPAILRNNDCDMPIFKQVFYDKQYELYGVKFPEAKTIIDGGANIGMASLWFTINFPEAEIVAIEPEKNNFDLLQKNTSEYKNIECIQAGLWDNEELVYITNPETPAAGFMIDTASTSTEYINGITINSILNKKKWTSIDILKLDIEGAEKEVFSATDISWLHQVKLLIIELHDRYKPGTTKAIFKCLDNFEYEAYFHHENAFIFFTKG